MNIVDLFPQLQELLTRLNKTILVGDIGGTNTRLALFDPPQNEVQMGNFATEEISNLEDTIKHFLEFLNFDGMQIDRIILGVAGLINEDELTVQLTNANLFIDGNAVQKRFGPSIFRFINDLDAVMYAAAQLRVGRETDLIFGKALTGNLKRYTTLAVACSTGAGAGVWLPESRQSVGPARVIAPENGHMSCCHLPQGIRSSVAELLRKPDFALTYEDILSGAGVVRLYLAFGGEEHLAVQEVMVQSEDPEHRAACAAVELWAQSLGSFLRDLTLAYNAERIILMGSVNEKNISVLKRHAAQVKERLTGDPGHIFQLGHMSVEVVTGEHLGLHYGFQLAADLDH